jgi:hypothetical protein
MCPHKFAKSQKRTLNSQNRTLPKIQQFQDRKRVKHSKQFGLGVISGAETLGGSRRTKQLYALEDKSPHGLRWISNGFTAQAGGDY